MTHHVDHQCEFDSIFSDNKSNETKPTGKYLQRKRSTLAETQQKATRCECTNNFIFDNNENFNFFEKMLLYYK